MDIVRSCAAGDLRISHLSVVALLLLMPCTAGADPGLDPFRTGAALNGRTRGLTDPAGRECSQQSGALTLPNAEMAAWFRKTRSALEHSDGLNVIDGPAILAILAELESDKARVEDMGALNRWPSRSGVALETYLDLWEKSCGEIRAPGQLPARLRTMLEFG
jgi:hypothetical protein